MLQLVPGCVQVVPKQDTNLVQKLPAPLTFPPKAGIPFGTLNMWQVAKSAVDSKLAALSSVHETAWLARAMNMPWRTRRPESMLHQKLVYFL